MIQKLTTECVTEYAKKGSGLIATVTQHMHGDSVSTGIAMHDSEDYEYIYSVYPELLSEERIIELVDFAFMQVREINKPASKCGDPIPEIDENQSCIATFTTEYGSIREWNGKKVEVLGVLANPNDNTIIDPECMPMFHVRMIGSENTNTAEVDELKGYEDPRMNAALKGLHGALPEDDYSDELKQFYAWGKELVAYKD